jgi:hypothetical protein
MKTVYCTIGGSLNDVCHVSTCKTLYPANWPRSTRQDECNSTDDIKKFISETGTEFVSFAVRASGIPAGAVKVSDTEKFEKVLRRFEKVLNSWGKP